MHFRGQTVDCGGQNSKIGPPRLHTPPLEPVHLMRVCSHDDVMLYGTVGLIPCSDSYLQNCMIINGCCLKQLFVVVFYAAIENELPW